MTRKTLMVGAIGPTNFALIEKVAGLKTGTIEASSRRLGEFLASNGFGLTCVPDRGVGLWALEAYAKAGGKESLALNPKGEESLDLRGNETKSHISLAASVKNDLTWDDAPAVLARLSDTYVCLGMSCGTMIEIAWTKWLKRFPVFVLSPNVTGIPVEVLAEVNASFHENLEGIETKLLELKRKNE